VQPIKISDKLSVAAQPALEDIPAIAQAGFTMILNNRPDGEDAVQPSSAAEAAAASEAGLRYRDIPVAGPTITEEKVRSFQAALAEADGPVLAHCKSGTRSLTLWVLGEVMDGRMSADQVRSFGAERGIALSGALNWLSRHRWA